MRTSYQLAARGPSSESSAHRFNHDYEEKLEISCGVRTLTTQCPSILSVSQRQIKADFQVLKDFSTKLEQILGGSAKHRGEERISNQIKTVKVVDDQLSHVLHFDLDVAELS